MQEKLQDDQVCVETLKKEKLLLKGEIYEILKKTETA